MCDKKWIFHLAFTADVTSHLNDLYLELQEKDKLIPKLVNDISASKMGFKPIIVQLKSKDFSKFPQLIEQSERAEDLTTCTECIEKNHINTRGL